MILVIPMAGRGSRFSSYAQLPKPLIPVAGKPMIAWALQGLADLHPRRTVFVALQEHEDQHQIRARIRDLAGPQAELVLIPDVTAGQLCTVMAARHLLDPGEDVLVGGCDTYVAGGLAQALAERAPSLRGLISVADLPGDRWSFARTDDEGRVLEVAEKVRISDHACTGLYWFSRAAELLAVADAMVAANERTRGEFYVMPAYRHYIERGWPVGIAQASEVWDMGTPEAAAAFEAALAAGLVLPKASQTAPLAVKRSP